MGTEIIGEVYSVFKRIFGGLLLPGGLGLTVLTAIAMAYDIHRNFTVSGKGLDALVELIVKYELKNYILLICLGVTVALSSLALFLSPRRIRVAAPVVVGTDGTNETEAATAADPSDGTLEIAAASGETPEEETAVPDGDTPAPKPSPRLVGTYYTHLMGTGLANPGGRDRQRILSELRAGDVAMCRTVVKAAPGETETVGVFTVRGEQVGFIDLSVLRAVRLEYPDHRIGVTIERVSGGHGRPYTCAVRVGVYGA